MSWYKRAVGKPGPVSDKVRDPYMPEDVREAIKHLLALFPHDKGVSIVTDGHVDMQNGGNARIEIFSAELAHG